MTNISNINYDSLVQDYSKENPQILKSPFRSPPLNRLPLPLKLSRPSSISADIIDKEGKESKYDNSKHQLSQSTCSAAPTFGSRIDVLLPYTQEHQYSLSRKKTAIADIVNSCPQAKSTTEDSLPSTAESLLPNSPRCCEKDSLRFEEGRSSRAAFPVFSRRELKNENIGDNASNITISTKATPFIPKTASGMKTTPHIIDRHSGPISTTADMSAEYTKTSLPSAPHTPLFSPRVLEVIRNLTEFDAYEIFLIDEFIHNAIFDVVHGTCNGVGFYDEKNKIKNQETLKQLIQQMDAAVNAVKNQRSYPSDVQRMTAPTSVQPPMFSSRVGDKNQETHPQYLPGSIATERDCSFGPGESVSNVQDQKLQESRPSSSLPMANDARSKKCSPPSAKLVCKKRKNYSEESKLLCNTMPPTYIQPHHKGTPILPKLYPSQMNNSASRTSTCDTRTSSQLKRVRDIMQAKLRNRMEKQKNRWKVKKTLSCQRESNTSNSNEHINSSQVLRNVRTVSFPASPQDTKRAVLLPSAGCQPLSNQPFVSGPKKEKAVPLPFTTVKVDKGTPTQATPVDNEAKNKPIAQSRYNMALPTVHSKKTLRPTMLSSKQINPAPHHPSVAAMPSSMNKEDGDEEKGMTTETESDESDISVSDHSAGDDDAVSNKRSNTAEPNKAVAVSFLNNHGNGNQKDEGMHSHDQKRLLIDPISDVPSRNEPKNKMLKPGVTGLKRKRIFVMHNYSDHASDSLISEEARVARRRAGREPENTFPANLHIMLSAVEANGQSDIVSWQPHGRAFRVHKPDRFVGEIMPHYFRQTKLTSFQRQLNLYNYRRMTALGLDKGAYYHELFLRGRPDLVTAMRRSRLKGTGYKAAANPKDEPDFYSMYPVGILPET